MSDQEENVIELIDETGTSQNFRLEDVLDLHGVTYYLVEAVSDASCVLLLKETAEGLEAVAGEEFDELIEQLQMDGLDYGPPGKREGSL